MMKYEEEANGIFSFQTFTERFCRSILSHVRTFGSWHDAGIRQERQNGEFYTAKKPGVRSAACWHSLDESKVFRRFDKQIDEIIKPFVEQAWQRKFTEHAGTQIVR